MLNKKYACWRCTYFDELDPIPKDPDDIDYEEGFCKINPPRASLRPDYNHEQATKFGLKDWIITYWPVVHACDRCGKYDVSPE